MNREDYIKLARCAVAGVHRPEDECSTTDRDCPAAVRNPASFDPPEWVIEAMQAAYNRGARDAHGAVVNGLYPEGG